MGHSGNGFTGRLVANAGKQDWDELTAEYATLLMEDLGVQSPECSEGTGARRKPVNRFASSTCGGPHPWR
jgi:hypothetical protein